MNLFIALNKVLFSINERVGHLGGKEVNREFRHRRFLACEQALRGALAAGREKEGELATTIALLSFPHGSYNFRETKFKDFSRTSYSF